VGLEAYCEDFVAALDMFWQRCKGGVTVVHSLPLANDDIIDAALINNIYNA